MRTAIDILLKDHDRVRKLLSELSETTVQATKRRPELLKQIKTELEVHTALEEEIFYPAVLGAARNNEERAMVEEAVEEHRAVEKLVLADLEQTQPDSVQFGGRAKVLKELVEHHAAEEEEEMFPFALERLGEKQLAEMGERLMARKQQLLRHKRAA